MRLLHIPRSRVMVSRRRVCYRCYKKRIMRLGRHVFSFARRYECLECGAAFRGIKLLGIRIGM